MFRFSCWLAGCLLSSTTVTVMPIQAEMPPARVEPLQQSESRTRQPKTEPKAENRQSATSNSLCIDIIPSGWGNASVADIRAVCLSAANELWKHFPDAKIDPISIRYSKRGPMALYGRGSNGVRRVLLNVRDTYWSQFAYQFGHEFCHILCNYRRASNPNLWFEESLCETASLFVMRRMAETWKTKPPYPNWKNYASALGSYADDRIKATKSSEGKTLAEWYREQEARLRKNATDRSNNQIVAIALLPLFEKAPQHWQAVKYLNQWDASLDLSFEDYLLDWYRRVPKGHKSFIAEIAALFEITVSSQF